MKIQITIEAEVELVTGKAASRKQIVKRFEENLHHALDDLDLMDLGSDYMSAYEVTDSVVRVK